MLAYFLKHTKLHMGNNCVRMFTIKKTPQRGHNKTRSRLYCAAVLHYNS